MSCGIPWSAGGTERPWSPRGCWSAHPSQRHRRRRAPRGGSGWCRQEAPGRQCPLLHRLRPRQPRQTRPRRLPSRLTRLHQRHPAHWAAPTRRSPPGWFAAAGVAASATASTAVRPPGLPEARLRPRRRGRLAPPPAPWTAAGPSTTQAAPSQMAPPHQRRLRQPRGGPRRGSRSARGGEAAPPRARPSRRHPPAAAAESAAAGDPQQRQWHPPPRPPPQAATAHPLATTGWPQ